MQTDFAKLLLGLVRYPRFPIIGALVFFFFRRQDSSSLPRFFQDTAVFYPRPRAACPLSDFPSLLSFPAGSDASLLFSLNLFVFLEDCEGRALVRTPFFGLSAQVFTSSPGFLPTLVLFGPFFPLSILPFELPALANPFVWPKALLPGVPRDNFSGCPLAVSLRLRRGPSLFVYERKSGCSPASPYLPYLKNVPNGA